MSQANSATRTTSFWPPVLPREHGSWGTFGGLILATIMVIGVNVDVVLTMLAGTSLFMAREPLSRSVKLRFGRKPKPIPKNLCLWAGVYLLISGVTGALLVLNGQLWGLLGLAAAGLVVLTIHLIMAARRLMMTAWGEWIGVLGVSLIIPALYLAAHGKLDVNALCLWLIGLIQVTGPIFYIRLKVRTQARLVQPPAWKQRIAAAKHLLLFSIISIILIALCGKYGWAPTYAWIALLPSFIKHVWGTWAWTPRGQLNIKQLGWIEVGNIILFALLLAMAYHLF